MSDLSLRGEATAELAADRGTVFVIESEELYGENADSLALPVATAFKIADLLLREFPHEFGDRNGE